MNYNSHITTLSIILLSGSFYQAAHAAGGTPRTAETREEQLNQIAAKFAHIDAGLGAGKNICYMQLEITTVRLLIEKAALERLGRNSSPSYQIYVKMKGNRSQTLEELVKEGQKSKKR